MLFINGVPDDRQVEIIRIRKDGVIGWMSAGADIHQYMRNNLITTSAINLDTNPNQEFMLNGVDAVFNQISDADSYKIALSKADNFYTSYHKQIPFFNAPKSVMKTTRDNTYSLLKDIKKLHVPKTVKFIPKSPSDIYDMIKKESFTFPVIFRKSAEHGGKSTLLIKDKTEGFYKYPLDNQEYYLTQYIDYSDNKLFSKYRLVVVDGEIFIRHCIFSKEWEIHSKQRKEEYNTREKRILKEFQSKIKPKIQDAITDIYNKLELDYFGIDCSIDDKMNITIFEINASMNILIRGNNYRDDYTKLIHNAVEDMILHKKLSND